MLFTSLPSAVLQSITGTQVLPEKLRVEMPTVAPRAGFVSGLGGVLGKRPEG